MIESRAAIQAILDQVGTQPTIQLPVEKSLFYVLAEDITSSIDMPPFDQSAMDGYAVYDSKGTSHKLVGESSAGSVYDKELKAGESVRIFTGAQVPEGASYVVKQEDVEVIGEMIEAPIQSIGKNIRPRGEQIKKGEIAVRKGSRVNPGMIGYLTTLGITTVPVYKRPKVTIISTGSELVSPGKELKKGQIYESNSLMLNTAILAEGLQCETKSISDSLEETREVLRSSIEENDVLVITGGISVGDYDYVESSLNDIGANKVFHKVAQKPGKPIYFGTKNEKLIFGLPGNPAAALSCFYLYVIPGLRKMQGSKNPELLRTRGIINSEYNKNNDFTHFLKAKLENGKVDILGNQSSAMLNAYSESNCIAIIEGPKGLYSKGSEIEIVILPR